jgi:NAD(P)-dependent dehydrogenase (short-subunit alcohol dehydrogenase family)
MATYLITGTSRGIGLELTKQLLELPATQVGKVFAVTRSALSGPLQSLISSNPDRAIHIVASVDDTASVQRAAGEVKEKLGAQGLDVLVNNAGLLIPNRGGTKAVTPEHLARQFDVNVIGVQSRVLIHSTSIGAWSTRGHQFHVHPLHAIVVT